MQCMASTGRTNRTSILAGASVLVIVTACILTAGCTAGTSAPGPVVGLTGVSWSLDSYLAENGTLVPSLPDSGVFARFDDDGRVAGSAGCNEYGGEYAANETGLSISSLAQTLKLCLEPEGIMDQEARFMDLLGSAAGYRIENGTLILTDAAGATTLLFVKGPEPSVLAGSDWTLASLAGEDGALFPAINGTTVTASFGTDGRLGGSAGCNIYGAGYTADGANLTIEIPFRTEMYCMDPPGVMDQEDRYLALLTNVSSYAVVGDLLVLSDRDGADLLVFDLAVRQSPFPLIGTDWVLDAYATGGDAVSSVIAGTTITVRFAPDGNVTGNAGCNGYGGRYDLDGENISVSSLGRTLKLCPEPEGIMMQEDRYLDLLGAAVSYRVDGDRLDLLDRDGKFLLSYRADGTDQP
jgi:heat shock protein HslJ